MDENKQQAILDGWIRWYFARFDLTVEEILRKYILIEEPAHASHLLGRDDQFNRVDSKLLIVTHANYIIRERVADEIDAYAHTDDILKRALNSREIQGL